MSAPTEVDARGRDRVVGPEEEVYATWARRTGWAIGLALALALLCWFIAATAEPPVPEAGVIAWLSGLVALVLIPARIVVAALRDAAAATGR